VIKAEINYKLYFKDVKSNFALRFKMDITKLL